MRSDNEKNFCSFSNATSPQNRAKQNYALKIPWIKHQFNFS
jgi:hypothetical protein